MSEIWVGGLVAIFAMAVTTILNIFRENAQAKNERERAEMDRRWRKEDEEEQRARAEEERAEEALLDAIEAFSQLQAWSLAPGDKALDLIQAAKRAASRLYAMRGDLSKGLRGDLQEVIQRPGEKTPDWAGEALAQILDDIRDPRMSGKEASKTTEEANG